MNTLDLRAVRLSLGWTQQQTAKRLAVSQAWVSMVENRQRSLTAAMLDRLGRHYQVDPAQLQLRAPVTMTDSEFVFVYSTFPDDASAKRVAEVLVREKLAACVNIHGPILVRPTIVPSDFCLAPVSAIAGS